MKTFKKVPERDVGNVGDIAKVGARTYQKAGNGVWGLVITPSIVAQAKELYCVIGMNLREVASALCLPGHPNISHSTIQSLCNREGWMRSHYGQRDSNLSYLKKNKKKIIILYDNHACTLAELKYVTGLSSGISTFFSEHLNRPRKTTGTHLKKRLISCKALHTYARATWNRILSMDANECTYLEYKAAIRTLTDVVYRRFFYSEHIQRSMQNHVDHILSLRDGYWTIKDGKRVKRKKVVPFCLMAHPENMRLVTSKINLAKGDKSIHSVTELSAKVKQSEIQLIPINRKKELRDLAKHYGLERYEG